MRWCEFFVLCLLVFSILVAMQESSHLVANVRHDSLKLHLYRSLGISATQDPCTGEFTRAIVRQAPSTRDSGDGTAGSKGDVNIINVDGKLSRGFYARMFWDAL